MTGKYTALEHYLHDLPATQKEVKLSFDQIERILNSKLPSSAYEDRRWWDHETEGNMSLSAHGQVLAGRLRVWTSTRSG